MGDWVNRMGVKKLAWMPLLAAIVLLGGLQGCAQHGLRVYFVRHGEAGHNVVKDWKDKPKSEWPAYVGNANMFTPKGDAQAVALIGKLKGIKFDFIACGPYWRTRHTILPYLKATGQRAEIWPELEETLFVPAKWTEPGAKWPAPRPNLFDGVNNFGLPEAEKPYFYFMPDDKKFLKYTDDNKETEIGNDLVMTQKDIDMIKARFGGSHKTILLVGHGDEGSTLIRMLTTSKGLQPGIENTGIWMAEQQPDGSFKLKIFNGKRYRGK